MVIVAAIIWIAWFAFAAGWAANRRDRLVPAWTIYGAVLGPVALFLLWIAPHGHCLTCLMPTRGWSETCAWCNENVNVTPVSASRSMARAAGAAGVGAAGAVEASSSPSTPHHDQVHARADSKKPPADTRAPRSSAPLPPERPAPATTPGPGTGSRPEPMAHRPRGTHDDVPASVVTALQAQAPRAVGSREPTGGGATTVIATATYVTGTARLEPGRRYVLALHATRLQILGPVDLDPMRVALERPVADLDARALEGRVILSDRGGSGMVLAFMSVAGTTVDELLGIIRSRARERGA